MVTYLDWIVILVTVLSAISMSFETPVNRIVEQPLLQVFYQKKNVLKIREKKQSFRSLNIHSSYA